MTSQPVILAAKRTPIGKFFGGLSRVPSPILGSYAVKAALDGLGVALVREPYVADDLRVGRLAAPFPLAIEDAAQRWRLIYRAEARSHATFRIFRRWLLAKAKTQT